MKWLIDLIQTPSAFRDDPWGYARNQIGHGYAIGFLGTLWLGWWWVIPFYIAIEVYQITARGGEVSDSIEDFANVAVMVLAATTLHPGYLAIHAIYLLAGFIWRREMQSASRKGKKWQS